MAATELEVSKHLGLSVLRHNQAKYKTGTTIQDWHYENSPDHPLFVYATEDGQTSTITWSSAVMAFHRAARIVCDLVERNPVSSPAKPVIAILMAGNVIQALSGLVLTVCNPLLPPIPPNPFLIMKDVIATGSDYIFTHPVLIEVLAKIPDYVRYMASIDGLIFCGGLLPTPVGDSLTSEGVMILNAYGSSECSIVSTVFPKSVGRDWEYFAFSAHVRPHFVAEDDGSVELVMMAHQTHDPCIINISVDGQGGYATSDLLLPHPSRPGYWKVLGRKDDRIVHSHGEKTDPAPYESILVQDPLVRAVVMFGNGRVNAGVLVEPVPEHSFDPTDQQKLATFRAMIWPTVEKMNETASEQSRVYKEMILVTSPLKPFSYTAKATPRRKIILDDYESEINAVYAAFQELTQGSLLPPLNWDLSSATNYIRGVVCRILGRSIEDATDLAHMGHGSPFATMVRHTLLHALSTAEIDIQSLPYDLVSRYPSISALGVYVSGLAGKCS